MLRPLMCEVSEGGVRRQEAGSYLKQNTTYANHEHSPIVDLLRIMLHRVVADDLLDDAHLPGRNGVNVTMSSE